MSQGDFPNVLVVTPNNFNLVSGGGVTLTNLFRGWPPERLANIHEDPLEPDRSVCRRAYRLSSAEMSPIWPFSLASGRHSVVRAQESLSPSEGVSPITALHRATRTGRRVARTLSHAVFGEGVPRVARITEPLARWLNDVAPALIYTFLGSVGQMSLVRQLHRRLAVPVAVHVMDDWPDQIYRHGLLGPLLRHVALSQLRTLLDLATVRLSISPVMSEEFHRRYGYRFDPFHNALDLAEWLPHARRSWHLKPGRPFVVRYAGSILEAAQRSALADVSRAVSQLRREDEAIELWLHTPPDHAAYLKRERLAPGTLHLARPPEQDRVATLLAEADALILPTGFDKESRRYMKLSMPTKVPAYMVSGTPVVVYGPRGVGFVEYAVQERWGLVVGVEGPPAVATTLRTLMRDERLRETLGRRAQEMAVQNHDAARVRPSFQARLAAATQHAQIAPAC